MAWYTPAWRRGLSARRIRFAATRLLAQVSPGLARRIGFYGRGRAMDEAAEALLFADVSEMTDPLSEAEARYIDERCQRFDGGYQPDYWRPPWRFRREFFHVRDALFHGHTGRFADSERRALLTPDGAPENWNRDKPAWLRAGAPVEGVGLPVRAFSNYFHFLFEAALPLVAYFESGAALDARPVILALETGRRRFVEEVLSAIADAYGAELHWVPPTQSVACRAAVVWRLESPAADWFPARRETADRLADLLIRAAGGDGPAPAPSGALYLRRGREKVRNLTNADALEQALAARGAVMFEPGGGMVADQAEALRRAQVIVSVHGAGLANLLWARPGAHVIEIISDGACKSVYLSLSKQLGLTHEPIIAPPGDVRQNFAAPVEAVTQALDRALERAGETGVGGERGTGETET